MQLVNPMHEPVSTTVVATHGLLAVFGGIVHALQAHRGHKTKGPLDFIILATISTFSGALFALVAVHFFEHQMYLTHAAAGAGGFLGVEGLSYIAVRIRDLITK